jgi:hypothetical protein
MPMKHRSMRPTVLRLAGQRSALHVVRDPQAKTLTFIPSEHGYEGKPVVVGYEELEKLKAFLENEDDVGGTIFAHGSTPPVGPLPREAGLVTCPPPASARETCPLRPRSLPR